MSKPGRILWISPAPRGPAEDASPIHHLWNELDSDLQAKIRDVKIPGKGGEPVNPMEFIGAMSRFQRAVNKMIRDREFFDETQFAEVLSDPETLPDELRELRETGFEELTDEQVARFNRLLLESSFPDLIRPELCDFNPVDLCLGRCLVTAAAARCDAPRPARQQHAFGNHVAAGECLVFLWRFW